MDFDGYQTWLQELRPKFMMRTDNVWNRDVFNFGEPAPFQQNGEMQLLGQDVVDADKRLITAQQCSDRYAVFFNERQISDIFDAKDGTSGDDYYGVGALYRGVGSSSGQTGIETLEPNPNPNGRRPPLLGPFDYSVNGEGRILSHDLVLSPAIPPGQFRIVVTWTTAEQERGLTFPLLSYYSGAGPVWDDSVSRLTSALGNRTICDDMRRFVDPASGVSEGYWHPAGDTCDMVNGTFVHRANHGNVIRTQSQTINTLSNQIEENTAFGIFVGVGARGVDNAQPPIQQYLDADVTVEVYRYFPGQVPEHSLYPPIATFHLSDAEISGNSSAKYWHVFNLIKRGAGDDVAFDIEQVRQWLPTDEGDGDLSEPYSSGMIATDFDKIKDNMHASLTGNGISPILARMLEEQYGGNNVMSNIQRALQRGGGWANNLQVELDEDALLGEINANGFGGIWGGPEAEFADDGDDAPAALPEEARNRGRVDVPPR
ncbi:MAG: hypothetical protein HOE53_02020 [Candidatus Magasanikbacteria bacterium]|nr:hypothetical protein [Candidatus Magasanikbacteria bacterium]